MNSGTFADYLAGLDEATLTGLLALRPDVCAEPVPRGFAQLAQRLAGPASLGLALTAVNRDTIVVGEAIAALGSSATMPAIARLLDGTDEAVRTTVTDLCARGLAWTEADRVRMPEHLAAHWSAEIGGGKPVTVLARGVLVDDLRVAATALGVEVAGLRKPELTARVADALADAPAVAALVRGLPGSARDRLEEFRLGFPGFLVDPGTGASWVRPDADADHRLGAAGLLLRVNGRWEIPREVAVAAWLAQRNLLLTGRPDIPRADLDPAGARSGAQAAAQTMLHAVTTLLDRATTTPITALKKGGVGARERARLATRLALSADVVVLCIDLAYSAGLLDRTDAGYAPTDAYPAWRAAEPGRRWAALAAAWFGLEHAPTSREIEGDKELPPPLPLASGAGGLRRGLLGAAVGGLSVQIAGTHIDWFVPLHGYDDEQRDRKVAAAVHEGERLGVLASDVLTELGEHLVTVADTEPQDPVADLAGRVGSLLPETPCTVILQSDLTAVVSGQPTMAVSRVLDAVAVHESRDIAGLWRFTPASVRDGLDAGWSAEQLLAALAELSDRELPQPLAYLIKDAARRHGHIRVRGIGACVVADEATITEILHTRALTTLGLARLAPTVLSSPCEQDEVLARLRSAGHSPVAEDTQGAVILTTRPEHRASATATLAPAVSRRRLDAAELAARLYADPRGDLDGPAAGSDTLTQLAELNPHLPEAELALLSDAVDNQLDVLISYRDKNGNRTVRAIQPRDFSGRWLDSWCHLRNAQRDFTVANIESVAPPI